MNNENVIVLLQKIYNTLNLISTKGTETLYMAKCLETLQDVIITLEQNTCIKETVVIPIDEIPDEKEIEGGQ